MKVPFLFLLPLEGVLLCPAAFSTKTRIREMKTPTFPFSYRNPINIKVNNIFCTFTYPQKKSYIFCTSVFNKTTVSSSFEKLINKS